MWHVKEPLCWLLRIKEYYRIFSSFWRRKCGAWPACSCSCSCGRVWPRRCGSSPRPPPPAHPGTGPRGPHPWPGSQHQDRGSTWSHSVCNMEVSVILKSNLQHLHTFDLPADCWQIPGFLPVKNISRHLLEKIQNTRTRLRRCLYPSGSHLDGCSFSCVLSDLRKTIMTMSSSFIQFCTSSIEHESQLDSYKTHPPPWCRQGQLCSPLGRWQGPPSCPRSSPPPSPSICWHCRRFSCWSHHRQWPRHVRRGSRVALDNIKLRQNVNCRESHLKVHIFPGQLCPWHYTGIRMQLTQIKLNSGNFHPAAQFTRHKHGWRMSYAAKMRTLIYIWIKTTIFAASLWSPLLWEFSRWNQLLLLSRCHSGKCHQQIFSSERSSHRPGKINLKYNLHIMTIKIK